MPSRLPFGATQGPACPDLVAGSLSREKPLPQDRGHGEAGRSTKRGACGATTFFSPRGQPPELCIPSVARPGLSLHYQCCDYAASRSRSSCPSPPRSTEAGGSAAQSACGATTFSSMKAQPPELWLPSAARPSLTRYYQRCDYAPLPNRPRRRTPFRRGCPSAKLRVPPVPSLSRGACRGRSRCHKAGPFLNDEPILGRVQGIRRKGRS